MHDCLLTMKVLVWFLRGGFLQDFLGLCFSLPTPVLENSSHYPGGREIKGNLYSCDKHMKHFAKSRKVCGKGRKLQNKFEYSTALKGSADTQIQLKGKVSFRIRAYLWSNSAFCLHGGIVQLSYESLKETKNHLSQMFEVCVVNLEVMSMSVFPIWQFTRVLKA